MSFNGPIEVRVLAAQFSIDGRFVISGDVKGNIRLWHIEGVKQVSLGMALRFHPLDYARKPRFAISGRVQPRFWHFEFGIEGLGGGTEECVPQCAKP